MAKKEFGERQEMSKLFVKRVMAEKLVLEGKLDVYQAH